MRDSYGVVRQETSTLSSDGHSWLRVLIWLPDSIYTRRGVVQVLHGMAEHCGRYDQFARFLAELGYVVVAYDYVGHGKSVTSSRDLGCIPLKNGIDILLDDVDLVRGALCASVPDLEQLPLFLFGHSMGSYLARTYITRGKASDLSGVVLCGTGNEPHVLAQVGNTLSRLIGMVKGESYYSRLLESLAIGSFSSAFPDARTDYDWLCSDPTVVDAYCADPLAGFHFRAGGFAALTGLVACSVSGKAATEVPSELPLLFVSGENDPVGSFGKGVEKAAALYRNAGVKEVAVRLYEDMRHEILQEPGKREVFSDVEAWLTNHAILCALSKETKVF